MARVCKTVGLTLADRAPWYSVVVRAVWYIGVPDVLVCTHNVDPLPSVQLYVIC